MRVVAALGGDTKRAAIATAEIARSHELVVTHGAGPQIGLLALESEARRDVRTYPLDLLDAENGSTADCPLEQVLADALPERAVASLLTQVVVDALDPAFRRPTRPVGPAYTEAQARELARQRGWNLAPDDEQGAWRRVVAAPAPRAIVELPAIRLLLEREAIVICDGGGLPVVVGTRGARLAVEAVVDQEHAAALLARQLDADAFLLLTDAHSRAAQNVTVSELRGDPRAISSRSAVEAATWFVATTGRRAAIGALDEPEAVLAGDAGTTILPD